MGSAFDGRFKLSMNLLSADELYDLKNDPYEMVNLIDSDKYSEIRDRMHDAILTWQNETRDPFRSYYWLKRPWRKIRKKLRGIIQNVSDKEKMKNMNHGNLIIKQDWK